MLNYLKSELYRVFHSSGLYLFIGVCSLLVFAFNLVLWAFDFTTTNFPWATIKFSFSTLATSMNVVMFLTAALASIIVVDEFKFRTLSNSIAFGISRTKIYITKLLITLLASFLSLVIIEGVYIGSGYLLLDTSNSLALPNLLTATVACIPSFIAGFTATVTLYFILGSMTSAIWSWIGIIVGIPMITSILGLKFKFFEWLDSWLIFQVTTSYTFDENIGAIVYLWSSKEGMCHCLLAGFLGIIVFLIIGILGFRKKEL